MSQLTKEELDKLLSQPMYTWDITTMLSGVVDYLEFSEENLAWQRRRETKIAKTDGDNAIFEEEHAHLADSYKTQLIESAEYRFDVTLSQSVRYGGLTAFITTIELCAETFSKGLTSSYPKTPDGENKNIHLLTCINSEADANYKSDINNLKNLVFIRNCIVHASGLLDRYKYKDEIIKTLHNLNGFSVWSDNYLGTSIHIEKGAIEAFAERATFWVPDLYEICVNKEIITV